MIDSREVIAYFDRLAPDWDGTLVRNEEVIGRILDNAGVAAGKDVLDVATGTGVLLPDYLQRGAASVTAVDISPEMVRIAAGKFPKKNITILCADAETAPFDRLFDVTVVYNAFPHFPDPERLVARLASLLKKGGTLTVAHGMSREKINARHHGSARHVSNGLMPAEELAAIFAKHLTVTVCVSDDRMYQVAGRKE